MKANFHSRTRGHRPNQHALHQLAHHQQTTIFCQRTGHCGLYTHLKRIGVKALGQCPSREANQTLHHFTLQPTWAADMAQENVPQNQALWVCRRSVPDIPVCHTHRRETRVNAAITANAEDDSKQCQTEESYGNYECTKFEQNDYINICTEPTFQSFTPANISAIFNKVSKVRLHPLHNTQTKLNSHWISSKQTVSTVD